MPSLYVVQIPAALQSPLKTMLLPFWFRCTLVAVGNGLDGGVQVMGSSTAVAHHIQCPSLSFLTPNLSSWCFTSALQFPTTSLPSNVEAVDDRPLLLKGPLAAVQPNSISPHTAHPVLAALWIAYSRSTFSLIGGRNRPMESLRSGKRSPRLMQWSACNSTFHASNLPPMDAYEPTHPFAAAPMTAQC